MNKIVPSDNPSKHVTVIDVIRGVAALTVALFHIREMTWIGVRSYWKYYGAEVSLSSAFAYFSFPLIWGSIGVPIFFVISGYVIHSGSRKSLLNINQARNFWLRRFVRIWPTLIVALIITLACDSFANRYGIHGKFGDLSIRNAALNLLGIVGLAGSPYGSNGALWSLSIEIQFYIIYPLALIAWRKIGPTKMLLFTLILTLIGYLLFKSYGIRSFLMYYFSWWLGAYVADQTGKANARTKHFWMSILLLLTGCAVHFWKNEILTFMIWATGFATLLFYILDRDTRPISASKIKSLGSQIYYAIGKCGDFSYSLYAVHMPVSVAFIMFFLDGEKQSNIFWVALVLPVTMVGAYMVYRTAEIPSIRMLRQLKK